MNKVAANPLQNSSQLRARLQRARTRPVPVAEPNLALSREAGMQLESDIAAELLRAIAELQSARANLQSMIDDARPFADEILQSAIEYWAAVRNLVLCLRRHGRLHAGQIPLY